MTTPNAPEPIRVLVQDVFSLPEGDVILQLPYPMNADDFPLFKEWIELILRRTERTLKKEPQ